MMTHRELLEGIYQTALIQVGSGKFSINLNDKTKKNVEFVSKHSESRKGIVAVLVTLLAHKELFPDQDIRYHQAQLPNGFSGRTIDTAEITPFMKHVNFPSMSESGWLTRAFEQPHPYTLDYPGNITPKAVKMAFLEIIDDVERKVVSPYDVLLYLMTLLIINRDNKNIDLAKPHSLSIAKIIKVLEKHFTYKYSCSGASRLPVLAIYAAYECMMGQVARFEGKRLCSLASHNSADAQSGRIGDVDVNNLDGTAFEGVEIKHGIQITTQLVRDAYEKFKVYNTDRYYLLTTANMDSADWDSIEHEIQRVAEIHGCQVIVNGVYSTLKYYLRLLKDPAEFIDDYVELLKVDNTIKFEHKSIWNDIISGEV